MNNMTKTLRERYLDNEILLIGEIVKDQDTGEDVKILDRGSNYVTVESANGIHKKWIQDVISEETAGEQVKQNVEEDFTLLESGQIKLFGYETRNFDENLSAFIVEQFKEFDDLYSKHQIIKLLDSALSESNIDHQYELLEKVSDFYKKHGIQEPLIIEGVKNSVERMRMAQIIASIAEIETKPSPYETVSDAVKVLRKKYTDPKQWLVLWPFFKMVDASGITGILQQLPYKQDTKTPIGHSSRVTEDILCLLESSIDEIANTFVVEDAIETFSADELSEAMQVGTCTLTPYTSTSILSDRAKRLAETLLKRNMFQKSPSEMSQDDKEIFDSIINRRKLLVAQLAQKLHSKIKELQS